MAPTRYFVLFIFNLPFCFLFLFLAGDPVPVGFKPIRWLRPQPIPFPVGQKFTTGTVLSRVAHVTRQRLRHRYGHPVRLLSWIFSVRMLTDIRTGAVTLPQLLTILLQTMAVGFVH